jgi:hypothetical protein
MIPSMIAAAALGNASAIPRISSATGPACVIVTGVPVACRYTRRITASAQEPAKASPKSLPMGAG